VLLDLTRGSVAMGDDADAPHRVTIEVHDQAFLSEVLRDLPRGYLPMIAGGKATWVVRGRGGEPLAVMAQQWREPVLLGRVTAWSLEGHLHFEYAVQEDPNQVLARLRTSP
jgi:hypothetical protein